MFLCGIRTLRSYRWIYLQVQIQPVFEHTSNGPIKPQRCGIGKQPPSLLAVTTGPRWMHCPT